MKYGIGWVVLVLALVLGLGGCGVPREAQMLAQRGMLSSPEESEAEVRQELLRQVDLWERMDALMKQRVFGGTRADPRMSEMVSRTAALARRQRALMEAGKDDARLNAAVLEELRGVWREAATFLQP